MLTAMPAIPASLSSPHRPWGVWVVEDDAHTRSFFEASVRRSPQLKWLGAASTVREALAWLSGDGLAPDVLLVDLGLPDGSGIEVIRAAARHWPSCSIMVSTNFGDETHVMRSIEAGAAGYLLKDSSPSRMADEIRSLANGGSPISPIIARQILARFRHQPAAPAHGQAAAHGEEAPALLSQREKQVLDYITKGFTVHEIAGLMTLSHFTVRTFVRRIYSKLKVSSKAEAIFEARTQGLLS